MGGEKADRPRLVLMEQMVLTSPPDHWDVQGDATEGEVRMDQLLTVKEAARMLACSEAAVRKWIFQRRLPAVKVGRLTRLRLRDLQALVTKGLP
jgi:excisionase family DNA binding protein